MNFMSIGNKTPVSRIYNQALNHTLTIPGKKPELRPSKFPFCPILLWRELIKSAHDGHYSQEFSAMSEYFTSVGTTIHSVIQKRMGYAGNMLGNWLCVNNQCNPNQKTVFTHDPFCPRCREIMEYKEIEVNYKGITGHVDGITVIKGKHILIDYKTSSSRKISQKSKYLPTQANIKQILAYAYLVEKEYSIKIDGVSLIYLSRDNPLYFYEHFIPYGESQASKAAYLVENESIKFNAAFEAFHTRKMSPLLENKPCRSKPHYYKEQHVYEKCPLLNICFKSSLLKKELKKHYKSHPHQGVLP